MPPATSPVAVVAASSKVTFVASSTFFRSCWSSVSWALAEGDVVCFCGTTFAASEVAALVALSEL